MHHMKIALHVSIVSVEFTADLPRLSWTPTSWIPLM